MTVMYSCRLVYKDGVERIMQTSSAWTAGSLVNFLADDLDLQRVEIFKYDQADSIEEFLGKVSE